MTENGEPNTEGCYEVQIFRDTASAGTYEWFTISAGQRERVVEDLQFGAKFVTFTDTEGDFYAYPSDSIKDRVRIVSAAKPPGFET